MKQSKNGKIKIAFLCPYPFDRVGGQRFRFEQYFNYLNQNGCVFILLPFLSDTSFNILYKKGFIINKTLMIINGFFKRCFHLFKIINCDYIFIFREASPIGYPIFEWIIAKIMAKKIIYDFDDAIWLPLTTEENKLISNLKYTKKVKFICKWAYKVSVGNSYLQNYSLQYNNNSFINPTTIETRSYHNKVKSQDTANVVIGWTGTHSTLPYLDIIYPVLKKLEEKYDFTFEVIADREIEFDLKRFRFKKWNKETEVSDLLNFNIGIMPLYDDEWSKGKCGFKALQYMALGIPAVVSPVGVNKDIITEGKDGFCCSTEQEWYRKLSDLIENYSLRESMGEAAIKKVQEKYSVQSNEQNFLNLFK